MSSECFLLCQGHQGDMGGESIEFFLKWEP